MPKWEAEAKRCRDMLVAAVLTGHLGAYPGKLDGTDVVVLSHLSPQEGLPGSFEARPLAILWNDDLHRRVEVPHATVVPLAGD